MPKRTVPRPLSRSDHDATTNKKTLLKSTSGNSMNGRLGKSFNIMHPLTNPNLTRLLVQNELLMPKQEAYAANLDKRLLKTKWLQR